MRAHDLVHDMNHIGAEAAVAAGFDRETWDAVLGAASEAVNVDKGRMAIPGAVIQFGRDLLISGIFQLPFDVTFFCPPDETKAGLIAVQNDDWLQIGIIENRRISSTRPGLTAVLPSMIINLNLKKTTADGIPEISSRIAFPNLARAFEEEGTDVNKLIFRAIDFVLGTTALLGSKSTIKVDDPAPERLNKARAHKGKPAIGRTITIRLDRHGQVERNGTHASPIPHWRRGHIRRLSSGKMTPVPPTLVNWSLGDKKPDPKDYIIKRPS